MVRTIYVVFVEDKVSNTSHLKEYMFLCPLDYIRVGDIIKDPRYVPYMQVTKITPCSARVQEGFTLKDIQIESLNKRKVEQLKVVILTLTSGETTWKQETSVSLLNRQWSGTTVEMPH